MSTGSTSGGAASLASTRVSTREVIASRTQTDRASRRNVAPSRARPRRSRLLAPAVPALEDGQRIHRPAPVPSMRPDLEVQHAPHRAGVPGPADSPDLLARPD